MAHAKLDVIHEVIAVPTLKSADALELHARARKLLWAGLPPSLDVATARRFYDKYLDESPQTIWEVVHKTRREHAPALLAAFRKHRSLAGDFVIGATLGGTPIARIDEKRHDRLVRAGVALAKVLSFWRAAASVESSRRVAFIAKDAVLVDGIRRALEPRVEEKPNLTDLGPWLWFMSALAQDASPATLRLLARMGESAKERDELVSVLKRLWGYHAAESRGLKKLVEDLGVWRSAKVARSGGATLGRGIGLPAEGWWFEVTANADDEKPYYYRLPAIILKAHAGEPPGTFSARVQPKGDFSVFTEGETATNGLDLPLPPADARRIKAWFDAAGENLGVRWRWERAEVKTNLKGADRQRLVDWVRGSQTVRPAGARVRK